MPDHTHTELALPICAACQQPVTFYLHQIHDPMTGMLHYHPECCPDCKRKPPRRHLFEVVS